MQSGTPTPRFGPDRQTSGSPTNSTALSLFSFTQFSDFSPCNNNILSEPHTYGLASNISDHQNFFQPHMRILCHSCKNQQRRCSSFTFDGLQLIWSLNKYQPDRAAPIKSLSPLRRTQSFLRLQRLARGPRLVRPPAPLACARWTAFAGGFHASRPTAAGRKMLPSMGDRFDEDEEAPLSPKSPVPHPRISSDSPQLSAGVCCSMTKEASGSSIPLPYQELIPPVVTTWKWMT